MNLLFCIFAFLFTGCEQMLYDSLHGHQKYQCRAILNPDERRACEERHSVPYEVHKRLQEYPE